MKTRIIHTKIYTDPYLLSLTSKERFLFIFLITNENIGMTPYYEISSQIISLCGGLTFKELETIKKKFTTDKKFKFYKNWVFVANYDKYQSYKGEKNEKAYDKELNDIPEDVIKYCIDSVSIQYVSKKHTANKSINNKEEIINNKYKNININNKGQIDELKENDLQEIADTYKVPLAFVLSKLDDMKNYCAAKGKTYKDYKAALRNWVKNDALKRKEAINGKSKIAVITPDPNWNT